MESHATLIFEGELWTAFKAQPATGWAFFIHPCRDSARPPDLPKGVKISDVFIPSHMQLTARYDRNLLDGILVLDGEVLTRQPVAWSGGLYREFQPDDFKSVRVQFIPYSVWQNRGRSEMSVWLPLAPGK